MPDLGAEAQDPASASEPPGPAEYLTAQDRVLGGRAEAVLRDIRGRAADAFGAGGRPFFVEFAGTPKSGKSSTITAVQHFFRRIGYNVYAPSEGASRRTPRTLKTNLAAFNAWSACYALQQLLESRYHAERFDIAILDRGIFDTLAWFEMLSSDGTIPTDIRDTIHNFMLVDVWRKDIDLVLLFQVNPEVALERENANTLIRREGRAMNIAALGTLNAAYETVMSKYQTDFTDFILLDTAAFTDPKTTSRIAVDGILAVMETQLSAGNGAG